MKLDNYRQIRMHVQKSVVSIVIMGAENMYFFMYVESKICFIRRYGILFCFKPLLEAALNILQRKDTLIFCPIYVMQTNKSKEMDILSRSIPIYVHFSYQDVDAKSLLMTVVFCQQQQKIFSRAKNSFHDGWSKTRNSIAS